MTMSVDVAAAVISHHFGWLLEKPFCANQFVEELPNSYGGDFDLVVTFTNRATSVRVSITGIETEFWLCVRSVESPPPNPWSAELDIYEWANFEGVGMETLLGVRTEGHLRSLCEASSNLCRRYPEYFLPGNFLLLQNKMMAMINARKEA
jgi:hypothetical protein